MNVSFEVLGTTYKKKETTLYYTEELLNAEEGVLCSVVDAPDCALCAQQKLLYYAQRFLSNKINCMTLFFAVASDTNNSQTDQCCAIVAHRSRGTTIKQCFFISGLLILFLTFIPSLLLSNKKDD